MKLSERLPLALDSFIGIFVVVLCFAFAVHRLNYVCFQMLKCDDEGEAILAETKVSILFSHKS